MNQLIVLDAVRAAQAVLAEYVEMGQRKPDAALRTLAAILDDEQLIQAVRALTSDEVSLPIAPRYEPFLRAIAAS